MSSEGSKDFEVCLAERVVRISDGRLRLVNTEDRGRCLVAAVDLPRGARFRDFAVVPHGSDQGRHLAAAVDLEQQEAQRVASSELLAALDFLASLVQVLAADTRGQTEGDVPALWNLYKAPPSGKQVLLRTWHRRFSAELQKAVPLATLQTVWAHVVPNWRQLRAAIPHGSFVEDAEGSRHFVLLQETICGLWLLMSMCEHSCDPSCALCHDGDDLWLLTLRPIPVGSHLSTSYLNLEMLCQPTSMRRAALLESWGFTCACSKCLASPPEDASVKLELAQFARAQQLIASCRSPPKDRTAEGLASFFAGLAELRGIAERLHSGVRFQPTSQALLLLEAFLCDPIEARTSLREALEAMFGDCSVPAKWAKLLEDVPEQLLEMEMEKARDGGGPCALEIGGTCDPLAALQEAFRLQFDVTVWPSRREATKKIYVKSRATVGNS